MKPIAKEAAMSNKREAVLFVHIPRSLHTKLKVAAAQRERTVTKTVIDALETYLDRPSAAPSDVPTAE